MWRGQLRPQSAETYATGDGDTMRAILLVLFGLVLGLAVLVTCTYLSPLFGHAPDWRTGVAILACLAVTQWVALIIFRHHVVSQVLFGLILCAATSIWLVHSRFSMFWEEQYADGSSPVTWRSSLFLVLLLAVTQLMSYLVFRWVKRGRASRTAI
jgi:hypothetical protein